MLLVKDLEVQLKGNFVKFLSPLGVDSIYEEYASTVYQTYSKKLFVKYYILIGFDFFFFFFFLLIQDYLPMEEVCLLLK